MLATAMVQPTRESGMRSSFTIVVLVQALLLLAAGAPVLADAPGSAPPAALSSPDGMVYTTVGEPVEFTVCGESFVGGEIEIDQIDGPGWCERASTDGDCKTYIATPDTPGVHTLWFRIVDDENDMETAYAVTIEAAPLRGDECDDPPVCEWSPAGPLVMEVGSSTVVDLFYSSDCPDVSLNTFTSGISFPFFTTDSPVEIGVNEFMLRFTFMPEASNVGMYNFTSTVSDSNNGSSMCTLSFEVAEPICDVDPECSWAPAGPLVMEVGASTIVDVFYSSECPDVTLTPFFSGISFPFFTNGAPDSIGVNEFRIRFTFSPEIDDVGMYNFTATITDSDGGSSMCTLSFQVNEPDICMEQPTCGFEPAGPVKIVAGQTQEIKFSWRSQCPD